jgi:hypothetical protein
MAFSQEASTKSESLASSQANLGDTAPIVVIAALYLLIMGFGFLAKKR